MMRLRSHAPACRRALLLSLGLVLVATACSGDGGAASETSTTRATTTTRPGTTTTADPAVQTEADVVDAYEAASQAFVDAAAIPNPDFPALLESHVDPMLNQRRGVLTQLKFDGRVIRYPEGSQLNIEAESFELRDPEVAVLVVCVVDDGERYDAATGELLTDGQPGTSRWEVGMRLVDGRWRLAEQVQEEEWGGVAGCAVD